MVTRRSRSNNNLNNQGPSAVNGGAHGSGRPGSNRASREAADPVRSASARPAVSRQSTAPRSVSRQDPSTHRVAANPARPGLPAQTTALAPRQSAETAQYSRNSGNYGNGGNGVGSSKSGVTRRSTKPPRKRMSKGTKIGVTVLLVLSLLLGGGVFAFYKFISSVNDELVGGKSEEEIMAIQDSLVAREDLTDPFYVLLLGSDERAGDASMGSRADTCIVVRVDCASNQATMISIPRDTKIVYKGSTMKFNAAYAYDGAAGSIRAASDLLDIDISHYAEVNFETLVQLVDAVGGVEVDVPKRINDWMAGDVVIEEGLQTLDGEAALVFARSRAYADGDFARSSNQRLLIEALVTKVLSLPVDQIPGVIQSAAKCVTTDMTASDIFSLAMEFIDEDGEVTIYSSMVPSGLTMINGVSYVVTDQAGLNKMMEVVEAGGDPSTVETSGITSSSLEKKNNEG